MNKSLNSEKITLNKFNLNFKEPEIETKFRKKYFEKTLKTFSLFYGTVTFLYLLFGLLDKIVTPEHADTFLFIRFGIVFPLFSVVFGLTFFSFFKKIWQEALMFSFIVGGTGIVYMLFTIPDNLFYYGGLFLVLVAGFFLIRLRFINAAIASIVLILIYNAIFLFLDTDSAIGTNYLLLSNPFYISISLIGMMALYNTERLDRLGFYQRELLKSKQNEIIKINAHLEEQVLDRTAEISRRNIELSNEIKRKELVQKQLQKEKERAEESNRLKAAFLNNVSHEFRTPMNGILGFSELLVKKDETDEQKELYAQILKESCNSLLEVVTNTIEMSKIQTNTTRLNLEKFNLKELVLEVINISKPKIFDKNLEFISEIESGGKELLIVSDREKIQTLLTHLFGNAIKFTNKGYVKFKCNVNNEFVIISVIDTGIGIEQEMQKKIFEPFIQADLNSTRNFGGNGIGLSIVKSHIKMLGGEIYLQSETNKGTTVKIRLPLKR